MNSYRFEPYRLVILEDNQGVVSFQRDEVGSIISLMIGEGSGAISAVKVN